MQPTKESEDLAQMLRYWYRVYNCEHELPKHDDLVAKLDNTEPEFINGVKRELDRDRFYPISYQEAERDAEECAKRVEDLKNRAGERFFLKRLGSSVKKIRGSFEKYEKLSKEQMTKEIMEERNKKAAQYFKEFRDNITYFLQS
ncbi:MAG: hypothetical protein Q8R47_00090 [Nanoarchaeota archaeon]|nr:hypothetical protein [Nanoarchaeota archaeon]